MGDDGALFGLGTHRIRPGRVRIGVDRDVKDATAGGTRLPAAGVALVRSLADQIDAAERSLRAPGTKPWDRVPLKQLTDAFMEAYAYAFAGATGDGDPITAALADFLRTAPDSPAAPADTADAGRPQ